MIVTVPIVRVMQVPVDKVVDVIAVRHRVVAAARTVDVAVLVSVAAMARCAGIRVSFVDGDRALVDMIAVHRVEMPVVQVVDMAVVLDGTMPAMRSVNVTVIGMDLVFAHRGCPPVRFDRMLKR